MTKTPPRTLTEKTNKSGCDKAVQKPKRMNTGQVEFGGCCDASARFDKIGAKLGKVLTVFGEIEVLKEQICGLKETVEGLKTS